jgi:peptidyl carrier protein
MLGKRILNKISELYLDSDDTQLDLDTQLLELNIIDSSAIFDLVNLLRQEAGVVIPINEITPDNFTSVRTMLDLVGRLQSDRQCTVA